jgi:hypothetical protein
METEVSLRELREEDLDAVSGGFRGFGIFGLLNLIERLIGQLHFGGSPFGGQHFGRPFSGVGVNVVQTNTAVEIAVVIGGGSVEQVINQSNVVV